MEGLVFPVEQIPAEGLSGRRSLEPSWFALPREADDPTRPIVLQEPIEVQFNLDHSGRDVRLRLNLTTVATLTCSRCLNEFPFPIAADTRFTFFRPPAGSRLGREAQADVDDEESATLEGDEIDLSSVIYEQIVLSFPMKPLCHEGCKGLCSQCGVDRNVENCHCAATNSDPRWETLGRLKLQS